MGNQFGLPARNNTPSSFGGLTTQPTENNTGNTTFINLPPVSSSRTSATSFVDRNIVPPVYQTENLVVQFGGANNPTIRNIRNQGLSTIRPEILFQCTPISLIDNNNSLTDLGKIADFNYKLRKIKQDISINVSSSFTEQEQEQYGILTGSYKQQFERAQITLDKKKIKAQKKAAIKSLFNIKSIPDGFYGVGFLSLRQIFTNYLGYSAQNYQEFSDTKILGQLNLDLRNALENYSTNLLNTRDVDRITDTDPYKYDKTFNQGTIKVEQLRSLSTPKNLLNETVFRNTVNMLPSQTQDKIKLSVHLMSKELLVSKNLAKQSVRTKLVQSFGANSNPDGNPFDNVFGDTGQTVFDPVVSTSQNVFLGSLSYFNQKVLVFENRYLQQDNTVFIPGHEYFLDTSDRTNLDVFTIGLSRTVTETTDIINKLVSFDETVEQNSVTVFNRLTNSLSQTLNSKTTNNISHALFKLASEDVRLQFLLFKYLVITALILTYDSSGSEGENIFVRSFKIDAQNFSFDQDLLNEQLTAIVPQLVNRVISLLAVKQTTELNPRDSSFFGLGNVRGQTRIYQTELMETLRGFANGDPTTSKNSLLKLFIDLVLDIENIYSSNGIKSFLLTDGTARTRFNYLSSSTQLFLYFNCFLGLATQFLPYEFTGPVINNSFNIEYESENFDNIIGVLAGRNLPSSFLTSYLNIKTSLEKETTFIKQSLNCLSKISSRFLNIQQLVESYFLEQDLFVTEYETQLSVSVFESGRFRSSFDGNYGVLPVSLQEKKLVVDFSKKFNDKNYRLFGLGLPNGFVENLAKNIFKDQDVGNDKPGSIIKINVFCKLVQFPNVVLKPQVFSFDLNLFNLKPTSELFYSSPDLSLRNNFGCNLISSNDFSTVPFNEPSEELTNQKTSELLKTYVSVVSGLKLYEEEYLVESKTFNNKTRTNLFTSLGVDSLTKILTGQKLFDRIYLLLVDLNEFEIDFGKTNKNRQGILSLESIKTIDNKVMFEKGSLISLDMFFTIGT